MNLSDRDRRALLLLAPCVVISLAVYFWPQSAGVETPSAVSIPQMERRVRQLKALSAAVPARLEVQKKVSDELAKREKGLIQAETAAQAQAQMIQVVRRIAQAQKPPIDFRATELGQVKRFGKEYGEVVATISVDCGIDQLINLLADIGNQPEYIAVRGLTLAGVNGKQKLIPARITLGALVPKRLAPAKKDGML